MLSCGKSNRNNSQGCKKEEEDAFFNADKKGLVRLVWHASSSGIAHWIDRTSVSNEYNHSNTWMGSRHIHENGPGFAVVCSSAVSVGYKWPCTCVEVYVSECSLQREPGFVKGVSFSCLSIHFYEAWFPFGGIVFSLTMARALTPPEKAWPEIGAHCFSRLF
jgi:hypothetical protein